MLTDVKMLLYHIENIQWFLPNVQTQTGTAVTDLAASWPVSPPPGFKAG